MKNILGLLLGLLLTSCGVGFQYTTLNHAGHIDGIYSSNDYKIDTLNDFQVRNKLRTDFNFRYDIAQYALSQPASFDWNNRLLGNRYNWNRSYWGYSYYWDRTQMWNDWVWGYNSYSPHMWSPWGYDRWGYNYYGWNNYGWNNWGIWNNQINPNWGRSYINGRRSNTRITPNHRVINNRRVVTTPRTRTVIKNKPRIYTPGVRVNTPPRRSPTVRTTPRTSTLSTNSNAVRSNSRRKN